MPDINQIKVNFPIFNREPDLVFLDNASTTQKPLQVMEAMEKFYLNANANIHRGVYHLAERADQIYDFGRAYIANFIGALPAEVIFTKNATEAANMTAFGIGEALVENGDNVVVTELEHHANYLPWQEMARRKGAEFRVIPVLNENGELDLENLDRYIDRQTRVVAITQMSNVLGVKPDLPRVIRRAKDCGALVAVDAAQGVVHGRLNVGSLGVDAAYFTGHKIYGPMGIGVLFLKADLAGKIPPMLTGGGMIKDLPDQWLDAPAKFEAGTPNVAGVAGLVAAIRYLSEEIGMKLADEKERTLTAKCRSMLASLPDVKLFGSDQEINSMVSFKVNGVHPHDLASILAEDKICIRAGHHCAKPLLSKWAEQALARVSFGIYNDEEDLEKLAKGVEKAIAKFK